ncbi:Arf17p [Asimina triloba]
MPLQLPFKTNPPPPSQNPSRSSPSSSSMAHLSYLDPQIFQSIAGNSFQIPAVHSAVYYFPQGHAEHSSTTASSHPPFIPCQILAVRFLADPNSDEIFVNARLQPLPNSSLPLFPPPDNAPAPEKSLVSFAKILTPSDANNGGGFSVPRFCADSIFPPLDFKADPPVQTIAVRDVHGVRHEFRHIYRGTPRRHLLTTGWSRFVNSKKLVAGDSVVFMRSCRSGELFVGVRRTARSYTVGGCFRWSCREGEDGPLKGGKGMSPAESVAEAVELARRGRPFEVVYYPRVGSADFVVGAAAVEDTMKVRWTAGMRVKMAVETEDSSRMAWYQGTVSSVGSGSDDGTWRCSPWRMLQVTWDEPDVLPNIRRVSPWQVEVVPEAPQLHFPFPPMKKVRLQQCSEFPTNVEDPPFIPATGLTITSVAQPYPSLLNYISPAGMQGARHNPICVSGQINFLPEHRHSYFENFHFNNLSPKASCVSTELNIGSTSRSENSSPKSQGSVHPHDEEILSKQTCRSTVKDAGASFQLFGQVIHTKQNTKGGDSVSRVHVDSDVIKGYNKIDGVGGLNDFPFSCPYKQLHGRLDTQFKNIPVCTIKICVPIACLMDKFASRQLRYGDYDGETDFCQQ